MTMVAIEVLRACVFDGSVWQPGDVAEVARELAGDLIAAGVAELASATAPSADEDADADASEDTDEAPA